MDSIMVSPRVRREIALLAGAWNVSEGEAVARLIDHFHRTSGNRSEASPARTADGVPIHAIYQGVRVEAEFSPATRSVRVTTGPLAGHTFPSPSGAATAVVSALNPGVKPNRSGWTFWTVTATGKLLDSLRAG